jgi:putative intracellular protease/amidase
MAIDVAKLAEIEAALTDDVLTDEEIVTALHTAGLPETARVLRRALQP